MVTAGAVSGVLSSPVRRRARGRRRAGAARPDLSPAVAAPARRGALRSSRAAPCHSAVSREHRVTRRYRQSAVSLGGGNTNATRATVSPSPPMTRLGLRSAAASSRQVVVDLSQEFVRRWHAASHRHGAPVARARRAHQLRRISNRNGKRRAASSFARGVVAFEHALAFCNAHSPRRSRHAQNFSVEAC